MRIERLPNGTRVFADANVLTYALSTVEPLHSLTASLIERSARQEIQVFTPAAQAANVIHRTMIYRSESCSPSPFEQDYCLSEGTP